MGEEVLGPLKAHCPSVWECQGGEVGVSGWGSTLIEAGGGGWDRGFLRGQDRERGQHLKCKERKYQKKKKLEM